ncbi:MAG TPA: MotA/TolQ/ExbB proton channel family protein [Longimicrobiales bacterium]|nr:MotA/TolQ/ExbB proton channel family protein [Longimicrobiales bacterium]
MILAMQQPGGRLGVMEMVFGGSPAIQAIMLVTATFSLISWVIIFWKLGQFRRVKKQGETFLKTTERATKLEELARSALRLPDSPYTRVFRQGLSFFGDLQSVAAKGGTQVSLSPAQLQALQLTLEKVQMDERDDLAAGLTWLAVIGSVSPLLGLLGTVIGVMNSFLGVAQVGNASIAAVAPGIAEALVTTVAGLAVAIPAVIAYNMFVSRLNGFVGELDGFASEFIGALAREGRL